MLSLTLPQGLTRQRCRDFAKLVSLATGSTEAAGDLPWLAPALLFANDAVQQRLALPGAAPGEVLVQDYQAIRFHRDFPCDEALTATLYADLRPSSVDYRFALSTSDGAACAELETALRLVPARDIGDAKPAQFRPEALKDTICGGQITLSQAQVDRYLTLSGDSNPIHSDPGAVRAMGLDAPVVPGLMLVSLIQPLCTGAAPGANLHDLKARFLAPLCVGSVFRICVQRRGVDAATNTTRLRAFVLAADDRAIAIADLRLA